MRLSRLSFLLILPVILLAGSRRTSAAPPPAAGDNTTSTSNHQSVFGNHSTTGNHSLSGNHSQSNAGDNSRSAWIPEGLRPEPVVYGGRATLSRDDLASLPVDTSRYTAQNLRQPLGCKSLRSKTHISDGFCTSLVPVTSVVCEGHCMPEQELPWYAEFVKVWGRTKTIDYVCEDDLVRRKKVDLVCEDGTTKRIRVKVVRNCKCTRLIELANRPLSTKTLPSDPDTGIVNGERINRKHRRRKHKHRHRKDRRKKDKKRKKKDKKKKKERKSEKGGRKRGRKPKEDADTGVL